MKKPTWHRASDSAPPRRLETGVYVLTVAPNLYDALWREAERTGESVDQVVGRMIRAAAVAGRPLAKQH